MISNTADIPLLSGGNITLDTGKSALVLFYHMNSCVQYEASDLDTSIELSLPLVGCLYKPNVLTEVTIISLHLHKL